MAGCGAECLLRVYLFVLEKLLLSKKYQVLYQSTESLDDQRLLEKESTAGASEDVQKVISSPDSQTIIPKSQSKLSKSKSQNINTNATLDQNRGLCGGKIHIKRTKEDLTALRLKQSTRSSQEKNEDTGTLLEETINHEYQDDPAFLRPYWEKYFEEQFKLNQAKTGWDSGKKLFPRTLRLNVMVKLDVEPSDSNGWKVFAERLGGTIDYIKFLQNRHECCRESPSQHLLNIFELTGLPLGWLEKTFQEMGRDDLTDVLIQERVPLKTVIGRDGNISTSTIPQGIVWR